MRSTVMKTRDSRTSFMYRPRTGPSLILAAYAVNAIVHLLAGRADAFVVESVTKALITLLLGCYVIVHLTDLPRRVAWPLVSAQACALAGDMVLQWGAADHLLLGMAWFAGAQAGYLWCFRAFLPARRGALVVAAVVWAAGSTLLWFALDSPLREAVALYAVLLCGMGGMAWRVSIGTGVGGLLFVVSDCLLAARRLVGVEEIPAEAVTATYLLAQVLIVCGVVTGAGARRVRGVAEVRS
ncbi:lysoplasmalogenase family protein [Actinokineospora sp. HUAS TT18]|uniref:lysoplasmalogenase family protein n=1 Tax=Actinokineospora sp. HUAS TT18 TaxID=3447451 RepID=UPI003F52251F